LPIQNEILTPARSEINHAATSAPKIARRSDHELQLARRIDWRFLLPEPYLRRVAYVGPERGALPAALEHFSDSFRIVSAVDEEAAFDLVVLRLSEAPELLKVHALLVSGGFLYWEMKPLKWSDSLRHLDNGRDQANASNEWRRTLNLFQHYFAALEQFGFGDIQMHWQRPNFEACLEIIPMNEAAALDYAFSRPRTDFASRLKFAAGRVMMQSGLLAHLTPCFSLIARKS
jgi:hypothetical protein